MTTPYYTHSSWPATGATGTSSPARAELDLIEAGFALLPTLSGNGSKAVVINSAGTAITVTTGTLALAGNLATTGAFNTTLVQGATVSLTLPLVSGTLATLAGTETLSNKTLVAPALGTPASGVMTNVTGTAAGLTAGAVTTNANLTGPITSTGNATAIASQTGTGTKFVVDTSPTLITPTINTAAAVGGAWTAAATWTLPALTLGGTVSGGGNNLNNVVLGAVTPLAGSFTTLSATGALTYGGVTLTAGVTGTGNMVLAGTPTLVTPVLGAATGTSLALSGALSTTAGGLSVTGTGAIVLTATNNDTTLTTTGAGRNRLTHITGDQAQFYGWSPLSGGASADNAAIQLGTNVSYYGRFVYDNTGATILSIDNAFDNAGAIIQFRTRTLGTPLTPLSMTGILITVGTELTSPLLTTTATSSTGTAVILDGSNRLRPLTSSERFKNVTQRGWAPSDDEIDSFLAVAPMVWDYKENGVKDVLGFSAEDLAKVNVHLINKDREGLPYSNREHAIMAYQHAILRKLTGRILALEARQ